MLSRLTSLQVLDSTPVSQSEREESLRKYGTLATPSVIDIEPVGLQKSKLERAVEKRFDKEEKARRVRQAIKTP